MQWRKLSESPNERKFYNGRNGTAEVPCILFFDLPKNTWHNEDGNVISKESLELYEYLDESPSGSVSEAAKELIEHLQKQINSSDKNADPDSWSWGLEEGCIISVNQAKTLLSLIADIVKMDRELSITHKCITELYDVDDKNVPVIKKWLLEI